MEGGRKKTVGPRSVWACSEIWKERKRTSMSFGIAHPVFHVPLHMRVPGNVKNVVGIIIAEPVSDRPRRETPPGIAVSVAVSVEGDAVGKCPVAVHGAVVVNLRIRKVIEPFRVEPPAVHIVNHRLETELRIAQPAAALALRAVGCGGK